MIFPIIFIDQDICTQSAPSWKIVISEWWPVIAVSLNIGSGIHFIKPAKLYMCTKKTLQTQSGQMHNTWYIGPLFCTTEPLRERGYKNWITTTESKIQPLIQSVPFTQFYCAATTYLICFMEKKCQFSSNFCQLHPYLKH